MPKTIAVIPTDLTRTRLGLPSMLTRVVAGRSVFARTIERVSHVKGLDAIVVIHPAGQDPLALLGGRKFVVPVHAITDDGNLDDAYRPMRTTARKWALAAWRGGLAGATCYDELLPAKPILAAMAAFNAQTALLLGADWMLVDPRLCERVLALRNENADAMPCVFTQAPPGLCGIALGTKAVEQLVSNGAAMIGHVLGYVPTRPQPDPIGKDVCVQVDGAVRSCTKRFICDTKRDAAMIDSIASVMGDRFDDADALAIASTASALDGELAWSAGHAALPREVTLELTPRRAVNGPLLPQYHVKLNRPDLDTPRAIALVREMGRDGDVMLRLGGLGDALLHPDWDKVVLAAHEAGVLGICVETDLLADRDTLAKLLTLPIDVVSVRVNADRAATYEKVMGEDRFKQVIENLQFVFGARHDRWKAAVASGNFVGPGGSQSHGGVSEGLGLPWLVTRIVKTSDTLADLDDFYDKWIHYLGHAVVDPATSGCGLMPDYSPVNMAAPRRRGCRQVQHRMTILSDATVARCDQDWLGRAPAERGAELAQAWRSMSNVRTAHRDGRWNELSLCGDCHEWHRP